MDYLSDSLLIEAYEKAVELNLDFDFIHMIQEEMNKRTIDEEIN
jgi:developmental checkpoint coupling sporulation initiation to replication initiation